MRTCTSAQTTSTTTAVQSFDAARRIRLAAETRHFAKLHAPSDQRRVGAAAANDHRLIGPKQKFLVAKKRQRCKRYSSASDEGRESDVSDPAEGTCKRVQNEAEHERESTKDSKAATSDFSRAQNPLGQGLVPAWNDVEVKDAGNVEPH